MSTVAGETKVETGLVIKEGTNGAVASGINEFVWVPVHCNRKMFEVVNEQNVGILYDFGTSTNPKNPAEKLASYTANSGYREPDIVTAYDGKDATTNSSYFTTAINSNMTGKQFKDQLQTEFDEMKASVEKYKGFYIGRYETGNLGQAKAVVQKENKDINNQNWYVQYKKSKGIITSGNAKTSMIWGCQWDATLRWFQKSKDANVVNFVTNSTGKGNYNGTNGNVAIGTGTNNAYKVNNIYDMAGNVWDWTIEASNTNKRVMRRRYL